MSPEQVIRATVWTVASVAGIVVSFAWAQLDGTDPTTVMLGAAGLVGLVGLIWRLVSDHKATTDLIDQVQESLSAERDENQRLRDRLDGKDPK